MLIDQKHTPWIVGTAVVTAASIAAYVFDARSHVHGASGSTVLGLTFGIAGLALMIFLALLPLRRKFPHWRIGRAQTWLRGHIWMGLLVVVFVFLHSAFQMGGPLTIGLWFLLGLVSISGVIGVTLQQVIPTRLLTDISSETVAQQLTRELDRVTTDADALVKEYAGSLDKPAPAWDPAAFEAKQAAAQKKVDEAETPAEKAKLKRAVPTSPTPPDGGEPVRRFYLDHARHYFIGWPSPAIKDQGHCGIMFNSLRKMVPEHILPGVERLHELVEERRMLLRQQLMMRILLGWLVVHVPLSWALLLLTVVHAVVALRWGF